MMNLLQWFCLASEFAPNAAKTSDMTMHEHSIQLEHLAMATRWRCWLSGEDPERLAAVGDWWADEIDRWDRMLSKFDSSSEVTRLNRAPPLKPRKAHAELFKFLRFCKLAWGATSGIFDVTATSLSAEPTFSEYSFRVDPLDGTFVWNLPYRQLDFGGVAKGYVLDQLAPALREYGVTAALLDAGGSSLLTWDDAGDSSPWLVSIGSLDADAVHRIMTIDSRKSELATWPLVQLRNTALSYSATRPAGTSSGQTIDPRGGKELPESRACVVLTESAAWAEVLSTTALCMGEDAAAKYIKKREIAASRLGWLAKGDVRWYSSHD